MNCDTIYIWWKTPYKYKQYLEEWTLAYETQMGNCEIDIS